MPVEPPHRPDPAPTPWWRDVWGQRSRLRDHGPQVAIGIGLLLVVLGAAGFVGVLDSVQERDDLATLDEPVLSWLADRRSGGLTAFLTVVSALTGPTVLPVIVLLAALIWGFVKKAWWQAGLLAGAMIVSTLVSVSIKAGVGRPRPPVDTMTVPGVETTFSFPSGHTIGIATFLLVLGYLAWVRHPTVRALILWMLAVLAGVVVVALSRLYLGYHFVTDVVASVALAIAVLGGVVVVDRRRAVRAARRTKAS